MSEKKQGDVKRDFNPNLHYAERVDTFTKTERAIANLRRAALECGCTEEDGRYYVAKKKKQKRTKYGRK